MLTLLSEAWHDLAMGSEGRSEMYRLRFKISLWRNNAHKEEEFSNVYSKPLTKFMNSSEAITARCGLEGRR